MSEPNFGFVMPAGTDMIAEGDDAIRQNAEATIALYQSLNQDVDVRITAARDELAAEIQAAAYGGLTAAELIASRLEFGVGDVVIGIASDSTSDGPGDWPAVFAHLVADCYPAVRVEHVRWDDAGAAWHPPVIVQEGAGEPGFSGELLHDTFTRTTDLATPDTGGPWEVTTPESFVLSGQALSSTGVGRLRLDTGARDMTSDLVIDLDATGTGAVQNLYLYHGFTNGSLVQIHVNAGGTPIVYIYRRAANVGELVTSQRLDLALGVPLNAPAGPLTVTITSEIQNHRVVLEYGTQSWSYSWTITEAAYAAMEQSMSIYPQSATPGIAISEARISVADRPASYQTVRIMAASKGGGLFDYQIENWPAMFGREIITPGHPGGEVTTTIADGFSRSGEIVGTDTDTGQTWEGTPGRWTGDGSAIKATGAGIGQVTLSAPNTTTAAFTVEVVTVAAAAAQTLRLGIATVGGGVHGFYANLLVNASGVFGASAYVRTPGGGYRELGAITDHAVASSSSIAQTFPVTITRVGRSFTVKIGAGQLTYTITQAEADQLGDLVEIQAASAILPGFRVFSMSAQYAETLEPTNPVYGDPLDALVLSHGHNYGTMGADQFEQVLSGFAAFVVERRPSTQLIVTSQNPQFAPAASPAAHAARQAGARRWASARRLTYVPFFERAAAQPDGGVSWVATDGVHPSQSPGGVPLDGTGSTEWARTVAASVLPAKLNQERTNG